MLSFSWEMKSMLSTELICHRSIIVGRTGMERGHAPANSLRRIIHDLNGELFLIRGFADITMVSLSDNEVAKKNVTRILERSDEFENIIKRLRKKQQELEPDP